MGARRRCWPTTAAACPGTAAAHARAPPLLLLPPQLVAIVVGRHRGWLWPRDGAVRSDGA